MGDDANLFEGGLYINGVEIGPGIPDFECSAEDLKNEFDKNMKFNLDPHGEFTTTINIKIDFIFVAKLLGIYQWVLDNCPNRKVIHLMMYGKNKRVKIKNLKRALRITAEHSFKEELKNG